jgi:hypothetical protein
VFFHDSDGIERRIDFLASPLGLDGRDVRDTAVDVEIGADAPRATLWAMHPERVMESRIANVQILGIDGAHALAQLRTSIAIAREWSRVLLADCSISEHDRVRGVLRLNERIFRKCVRDLHFRQLFADRAIDPFDAVLADDDRLPSAFRERRHPPAPQLRHGSQRCVTRGDEWPETPEDSVVQSASRGGAVRSGLRPVGPLSGQTIG